MRHVLPIVTGLLALAVPLVLWAAGQECLAALAETLINLGVRRLTPRREILSSPRAKP